MGQPGPRLRWVRLSSWLHSRQGAQSAQGAGTQREAQTPASAVPAVLLASKRVDSALAKERSPGEGTGEGEFWPESDWCCVQLQQSLLGTGGAQGGAQARGRTQLLLR